MKTSETQTESSEANISNRIQVEERISSLKTRWKKRIPQANKIINLKKMQIHEKDIQDIWDTVKRTKL